MFRPVIIANDLSGIGKVALTNFIIVMACADVETAILPTAILSSHTGGFKNVYVDDYSKGTSEFLKSWSDIEISYSGLVTGYIKTAEQIEAILNFKNSKCSQGLLIVDPVMADGGKYYSGFDDTSLNSMKKLCKEADYIMPNITEACLLADLPYFGSGYNERDIENLIEKLSSLGTKNIIITGVSFEESRIGAVSFNSKRQMINYSFGKRQDAKFFGTGDLFAAVVSACIFKNIELNQAVDCAVEWLEACLKSTLELKRELKYGVCFESNLDDLIKKIQILANSGGVL